MSCNIIFVINKNKSDFRIAAHIQSNTTGCIEFFKFGEMSYPISELETMINLLSNFGEVEVR